MTEDGFVNTEPTQVLRETLATQAEFKGIEGKSNGIICLDDSRNAFLASSSRHIAWTALEQRLGGGTYSGRGLKGVDMNQLKELLRSLPNHEVISNSMQVGWRFSEGAKDYFTLSKEKGIVSYSWLPSPDSTGDSRKARNVLITKVSIKAIEGLSQLAESSPKEIYELLLSGLYPNSLIPLNEEEIISAIKKEGPELLRLVSHQRPKMVEQYEMGLANPKKLVQFVQSNSVWKRRKPCEEVSVQIE